MCYNKNMTTTLQRRKADTELQSWVALIKQLSHQVESWAKERKWPVTRDYKQIEESRLGTYKVPVLNILTPSGIIHLEPVARNIARGDGRVDLLSWPSLTRMMLIRVGNLWKIKTDSGVSWPQKWNQKTFVALTQQLNGN